MEVTVEIKDGLKRRLTVVVPAQEVSEKMTKRFAELRKNVRIDGYRPGHVRLDVIKAQFGQAVEQEAIGQVINQMLPTAIQQESLNPAGAPVIESYNYEPKTSDNFEFIAVFEIFPSMTVPDFNGVTLNVPTAEVSSEDVEQALQGLRKQACEWNVVDRASQLEDRLTIDYQGLMDGEKLKHSQREDATIILEDGMNTLGFEKDLVGIRSGDEKEFNVTIPDDAHDETLRGKVIEYHVKIKEVAEPKLPELDDAFAERYDVKEGGLARLKEELEKSMKTQLENAIETETKNRVINQLLESASDLVIPQALIDDEIERLRQQMLQRFQQYMQGQKNIELPSEMFEVEAKRRVSIGLLLHEFSQKHELEASQDEVDALINQQASTYADPEQVKAYYYNNQEALNTIRSSVLEQLIIKQLLDQATVVEESISYKELVTDKQSSTT